MVAAECVAEDVRGGHWLVTSDGQPVRAAQVLPVPTDVPPLESVDEHYHRADWVRSSSPDDSSNDRRTDDAEAALGAAALRDRAAKSQEIVRALLDGRTACEVVLTP